MNKQIIMVLPGTIISPEEKQKAEEFFSEKLGTKITFLESVETSFINGNNTDRIDSFFSAPVEDIPKFAVKRFAYGFRWWEDIYFNNQQHNYPKEVRKKFNDTLPDDYKENFPDLEPKLPDDYKEESFEFKKDAYAESRQFSQVLFKLLKKNLNPIAQDCGCDIFLGFSAKYQTPYIYTDGAPDVNKVMYGIENALYEMDINFDTEESGCHDFKITFDE